MITGSHNPKGYNGLKMMIGAKTIFGDDVMNLYHAIQNFKPVKPGQPEQLSEVEIQPAYLEVMQQHLRQLAPQGLNAYCGGYG